MTELHQALDDVAGEISPVDPPVDRAMRRGRAMRVRRRAQAVAGTAAGVTVLAVGVAAALPGLAGHPGRENGPVAPAASQRSTASPGGSPLARQVLLRAAPGKSAAHGDPSLVNAATMRLFRELDCMPAPNTPGVNDAWKLTVGYSATTSQWNAPGSEVVSCDSAGSKYVLGKAVIVTSEITSVSVSELLHDGQYVVGVSLDRQGTASFARLTTRQFASYSPDSARNQNVDDETLASTAIVIDGDVESAPVTVMPVRTGMFQVIGPAPAGFSRTGAQELAGWLRVLALQS